MVVRHPETGKDVPAMAGVTVSIGIYRAGPGFDTRDAYLGVIAPT